jgi:hypothetical protein
VSVTSVQPIAKRMCNRVWNQLATTRSTGLILFLDGMVFCSLYPFRLIPAQ